LIIEKDRKKNKAIVRYTEPCDLLMIPTRSNEFAKNPTGEIKKTPILEAYQGKSK
jgi:hypothetical protein